MSKEYLFRVTHIKNKEDKKIYKVLKINQSTVVNTTKFFMFKDNKFDWFSCNDFKLYEENKSCGTCSKCYSCNLKDNNYCNDYDMWEEANNND